MACLVQFGHENSVCYGQRALRRALARMRRLRERHLLVDGAMHAAAVMVTTSTRPSAHPINLPFTLPINPPYQPALNPPYQPTRNPISIHSNDHRPINPCMNVTHSSLVLFYR